MSNQFPSTDTVKISNVQLINIPSRCGVYLVEIRHNGEATTRKRLGRKKVNGRCIVWSDSLSFTGDLPDQSLWYFRIVKPMLCFMTTTLGSKSYELENKLLDLLKSQEDHGSCKLTAFEDCQLEFTIERRDDALPGIMNETENALAGTSTLEHLAKIANPVMKAADLISQADPLLSFLSHFKTFMDIVDTISEVHPYVHAAWSILSVIPKTIIAQNERDDSINKLSLHLKEVYEYITDAKRLPTLKETQVKALSALVQQTIECAYFLKEYATSNRASKILKGVISNIDEKVDDFNEKFDHILNVMTNSTVLEISIVTLRMSNDVGELREKVEELKELNLLEGMPRAQNAGFLSAKACLPGTRQGLITEILNWVNASGDSSQRVLLLLGQAGMGKSAVAHTISQIFDKQNRLGSVFCFSQSYKESRNLLFSTITRELADGDVQWRRRLVQIIEKTSVRTSLDTTIQFDELIVRPSKAVNTIGPVVIVIDGLDESGNRGERAVLLDLLFKRSLELPSNYRFIITSRPEQDIELWCKHPTVFCKRMTDIDSAETTHDIQKYISFRLSSVNNILDGELDDGWRFLLAKRAEGVFQWAKLACDIINPTVEFGVAEKVKTFTSGPTTSLYQMYHQIFLDQPEFKREGYLPAFKTIMGALVIMRKPPSIQALQSLFQNDFPYKIVSMMAPFHSLFLGTHDLHTPVRPLHTSLMDFLTTRSIEVVDSAKGTETISNQFYIDTSDQGFFTLACLKMMNSGKGGLRFNICNLETSHLPNRDVPDLDDRVQKEIPSHLSYASYFWAVHLQQSKVSEDLLIQLRLLMHTNILYLFETLGLAEKSIEQVCISMRILAFWCKDVDDELASQAQGACQFGSDFGDIIVESTPHLYISALPFASNGSFIRDQHLDLFPCHFNIELGQSLDFPRDSNVIKRHPSSSPTVVEFSPQGRYIATGFVNGDFWLWDYETGSMIYQCGTNEWEPEICTIVFSPNGESVTSCFLNGSFKTLNIKQNELVSHSYGVFKERCLYSTISSDGRYLVFQPEHGETLLYDIASRSTTQLGFSSIKSIFSPNGELLASSVNCGHPRTSETVYIRSIQKQELIGSLCSKTTFYGMAFSPDGNHMALICMGVIQIWNVLTAAKVREFPVSGRGYRVIFSPDGRNLFFSTIIGIEIMDVSTGALIQAYYSLFNTSHAVSSDCKHVAWTTSEGVIQVQECVSAPTRADPIDGGLRYTKAMFSPLNTYLALKGANDGLDCTYLQILKTATMPEVTVQAQLKDFVISISPNDQYIAYTATHGLCLWSEKGGEVVLDPSDRMFTALAFSFTSECLISGAQSGTVMTWNTHTCQLVCPSYTVTSSEIRITALAFSGTGIQFLVVYTSGSTNMIEIHSSQSGKLLKGPFITNSDDDEKHTGPCILAFSANESHFVYIRPWIGIIIDTKTGQTLKTFEFPDALYFRDLQHGISSNRKYIILTGEEKVEVWDIDTGEEADGKWHDCGAEWAAFSNSSEEFATMDSTGKIDFWDISSGNKSARPTFYFYYRDEWDRGSKVMLMNDKYLILGHRSVKVWSLETHQNVSQHQSNSRDLRMSAADHSEVEPFNEVIHDQSLLRLDDQERLEYALAAWKKALFSESSEINNGWVLGPNGELLFWVPEGRRRGLWRPKMVHFMGPPITKLTFDNFVHGSRWTECKEKL